MVRFLIALNRRPFARLPLGYSDTGGFIILAITGVHLNGHILAELLASNLEDVLARALEHAIEPVTAVTMIAMDALTRPLGDSALPFALELTAGFSIQAVKAGDFSPGWKLT